jgi:2-methylcitrate dehydratase
MNIISRRHAIAGLATGLLAGTFTSRAARGQESAAPGDFLADRLAAYANGLRFSDLDAATIEAAKAHLIDALGCAMVALNEEPVRICREVALLAQGGASTILGTDKKTTMDLAAFANGVAVRYFDYNDIYVGKEPGHPSDIVPACLAVGEAERASGQDLLTAIVLAYEINCRLLDAASLTVRGWDHPIYSLPAAALAAGKLMRLGPPKLTQAINLAISGHLAMNQTRVQVLSDWKGVADPDAVRNGVFAALLARGGLTGPAPIFEGRAGLFKQVSDPFTIDIGAFGGRGTKFKVLDCSFKLYPAQGYSLTAIPAGIAVAHETGGVDRITKLEIATTHFGYISAGRDPEKWTPQTRETADHSLPYIVARAMFDGDISNASFSKDKITDPRIRAFMQKITVQEDPALTALLPKAVPTRVTATLDDGRVVSQQVDDLPGFAGRRMERGDVEQKFRKNVAGILSDQKTKAALDAFWTLDRQSNVSQLLANFVAEPLGHRR